MKLLTKTLKLLKRTNISSAVICKETGLKPTWLHRLRKGDYPDPGVNKIERLHKYLITNKEER